MVLLPLMALTAAANPLFPDNPGLPPPWPGGVPFDIPSVCYVLMTAQAERLHSEHKTSRYEDVASAYFAAELSRANPQNAREAISMAVRRIASDPKRYIPSCADAFAAGYAPLGEPLPGPSR